MKEKKSNWFCPVCKRRLRTCNWDDSTIDEETTNLGYGDGVTDHCNHCKSSFQIRKI